jgi:hypothetical protein
MTIRTKTGETFAVRLEADAHGMVWLVDAQDVSVRRRR